MGLRHHRVENHFGVKSLSLKKLPEMYIIMCGKDFKNDALITRLAVLHAKVFVSGKRQYGKISVKPTAGYRFPESN